MEKSEPALAPEWLRNPGSVTGGGSSSHHFSSSFPHSDAETRKRNFKSKSEDDTTHFPFLDRSSSANSRRIPGNTSVKDAYSSFNRSHRDKDRDRSKDRSNYMDHQDRDPSATLGIFLSDKKKDQLRRSHSMVSRNQGYLPQRISLGPKTGVRNHHNNNNHGNGLLRVSKMGNGFQKSVFEKDFPSLGSEEKHADPDVSRVSSPGLSSAVQSLPVGSSVLIGGEGWTSALAEVPDIVETSVVGSSSSPRIGTACTGTTTGTPCLNMAEALVQAPPRTQTPPELSVKTQRLEELAIKQSRKLIPVTPSMPKGYVLSSSDKSKSKLAARTGEIVHAVPRGASQQLTTLSNSNQFQTSVPIKPDSSKKLLVLKPARENGVSTVPKDVTSPVDISANGRTAGNLLTVVPSVAVRSSNSPKERIPSSSNMVSRPTLEKRPSLSQGQSRNDFFKLLKQKNTAGNSTDRPGSSENAERSKGSVSNPSSTEAGLVIGDEQTNKDNSVQMLQDYSLGEDGNMSFEEVVYPDEKERAFLRSLGWEENAGEDEGLTEEEINAFYEQYYKTKPNN